MDIPTLRRMRRPLVFVCTEGITSLGIATTIFAIEVWVFQRTGSYAAFATIALLAAIPGVVLAPFAGPLIDRMPRGRLLCACATLGFLGAAGSAALARAGLVDITVAACLAIFLSILQTVRLPAVMATVSLVTEETDIAQITALEESVEAVVMIAAPLLGAWLLQLHGLGTLLSVGSAGFLASTVLVFAIGLPLRHAPGAERSRMVSTELFRDMADSGRWLWGHTRLRRMLFFVAVLNVAATTFVTVQSPRALSFVDANSLARILATGGFGLLCGSIAVSTFGGARLREKSIYWGVSGIAGGILISSISTGTFGFACGAFLFAFLHPAVNTAMQIIWRTETPPSMQGRVFSLRRMVVSGLGPLAIAMSVPLSSQVFAPSLDVIEGALPVARVLFGPGQAGGLGLMLAAYGLAMVVLAQAFRRSRYLEASAPSTPDTGLRDPEAQDRATVHR